MRIEQIMPDRFGRLAGCVAFHPGLNLILAENEAGKSTLAAAILALLYGVRASSGKRWMGTPDEDRYRPLQGGGYRVSGTVSLPDGVRLEIFRDLAEDRLRVTDATSGEDRTAAYARKPNGDRLGDELLGMNRGQYERVGMIRQDGGPVADFSEFSDRVGSLFMADSAGNVRQALDAMENARRAYDGYTGKGRIHLEKTELRQLHALIGELEGERNGLEAERTRAEREWESALRTMSEVSHLKEERQRTQLLFVRARRLELGACRKQHEEIGAALESARREASQLDGLQGRDFSEEERLSQLQSRLKDTAAEVDAKDAVLRQLSAKLEVMDVSGARFSALRGLDDGAAHALRILADRIQTLSRETEVAARGRDEVERELVAAGLDAPQADRLLALTATLAADEMALCRTVIERRTDTSARSVSLLLERRREETSGRVAQIDRMRERLKLAGLSAGGVSLLPGMCVLLQLAEVWRVLPSVAMWGAGGLAVLGMAAAVALLALGRIWRGSERQECVQERIRVETELAQAEAVHAEETRRVEGLASCRGLSAEELDTALRIWNHRRTLLERHAAARNRVEECRAREEARRVEAGRFFGGRVPAAYADAGMLARDLDDLRAWQGERALLARENETLSSERERLAALCVTLRQQMAETFVRAGLADEASSVAESDETVLAQRIGTYRELARKRRRWQELAGSVRDFESRLAALPPFTQLEREERELEREERAVLEKFPQWNALSPERDAAAYRQTASELQTAYESRQHEAHAADTSWALTVDRYRTRMPELMEELSAARRALAKAERFEAATATAIRTLTAIAADQHARWSPLFGQELNRATSRFSSRWRLGLTDRLQIRLTDAELGVPVAAEAVDRFLSRGALDQVFLSLRMLMANTLNPAMPLILDDPFVHADDARFREGMRMLRAQAENRQVFVFSCHAGRHRMLAEEDASWNEFLVPLPNSGACGETAASAPQKQFSAAENA